MPTTIRDVAEAAGVSAMAVSKVLHGKGDNVRVSKDKAEHIRKIAGELRYQPNHLARSFRSRKTETIGMIFERFQPIDDRTGYFGQLLNGVMEATFSADYSLTVCPKLIKQSLAGILFDGRFDGIVWCKPDMTDDTREAIDAARTPVVLMHVPPNEASRAPVYCCNNDQGLGLAVAHLVELGHTKIAFVRDEGNRSSVEALQRQDAFIRAMRSHGIPSSESDCIIWDYHGEQFRAMHFAGLLRHTALISFSENHAVCLAQVAEESGIRIPEQVSLVGFDSTSLCDLTVPKLTAISQPIRRMAFDATNALIAAIEGDKPAPQCFIYPCGLDIRNSTARPPISQLR